MCLEVEGLEVVVRGGRQMTYFGEGKLVKGLPGGLGSKRKL